LRGLLIDLDGVVYSGREPIPGGAGFLAEARRRGLAFLLVTNNSTASPELVAERLGGMGIQVTSAEVLTSAQAAAAYVRAHAEPGARVRIIGEDGLRQAAREEGLHIAADDGAADDWAAEDGAADDDTAAGNGTGGNRAGAQAGRAHGVDWVLAGLDRAFDYEKLADATRAILAGAHFVATNADALLPIEGGRVIPGAGSIVAAIETATGVSPTVVGKPEPGLFEHGLRRLGDLPPEQVAMIGDRLDTDVLGGKRAGLKTILVLSGVTSQAAADAAGSRPDAVVADLAAVAGVLGWR
jgi:4-nitrophenyl phosphatase